ncbi:triose-phosphate isomerase [bacterium]|nr:triose-phosphate isomerase [bacterium]
MRRLLIAGNWKMNTDLREAIQLATALKRQLAEAEDVDLAVFPPAPFLADVCEVLQDTAIEVGGQNLHHEPKGAFTGEMSAAMLVSVGCKRVLVGHSERRQYFGETDASCNQKLRAAIAAGLRPILCVGEVLEERKAGRQEEVVKTQVLGGLEGFSVEDMGAVTVAYEPVWAIGTGETATPEQANSMHGFIRGLLAERFGVDVAQTTRILYGGSMKPENSKALASEPDIDGGLIGGASLVAEKFAAIAKG